MKPIVIIAALVVVTAIVVVVVMMKKKKDDTGYDESTFGDTGATGETTEEPNFSPPVCMKEITDDVYEFNTTKYILGADIVAGKAPEGFDVFLPVDHPQAPKGGREGFAFSRNVVSDIKNIDLSRKYYVGRRVKSKTAKLGRNTAKTTCDGEFPDSVYRDTDVCFGYGMNETIPDSCYSKIWNTQGCLTSQSSHNSWSKNQTRGTLTNDSKAWSILSNDGHRAGCYTNDKSKWPDINVRNQYASIQNKANGLCVDVFNASKGDYVTVGAWNCGGQANQQFKYIPETGQFVALHSGKCLDVGSQRTEDYSEVVQYPCGNSDNQKWDIRADGVIQGRQSGKCLTFGGDSGTKLMIVSCEDKDGLLRANQRMKFAFNTSATQEYPTVTASDLTLDLSGRWEWLSSGGIFSIQPRSGNNSTTDHPAGNVTYFDTMISNVWYLVRKDWYGPYGGTWGPSTNMTLQQAQKYATDNGFNVVTYNPNPDSNPATKFFMAKTSEQDLKSGAGSRGWDMYVRGKMYFVTLGDKSGLVEIINGKPLYIYWATRVNDEVYAPNGDIWKYVEPLPTCGGDNLVKDKTCYTKAWKQAGCLNNPPDGTANWDIFNVGVTYNNVVNKSYDDKDCQRPIQQRRGVGDLGYPNDSNKEFKRGWYDILNQGVNNDYCRYVGDNPFFACVLSNGSNDYATSYKGRAVTDIAREKQYSAELLPFRLQQRSSGKCLHPYGGTANDETALVTWNDCSDADYIKYRQLPNGQIQHVASGKCLHPEGGTAYNGTTVVFYGDCSDKANIQYRFLPNGQIQNVGSGLCIHPNGGSENPGDGNRMVFWNDCSNAARIQYNQVV